MSPDFPTFRPRSPWWGPDLQTLRNAVRGVAAAPVLGEARRALFALEDGSGDSLAGLRSEPSFPARRPLVVLVHGLSGSEESAYMIASADFWLQRGHPVLRLNLRGAGPSRETCRLQYHAGRSQDLHDVLCGLEEADLRDGLILVGYSLGGNMLLKFLAEYGSQFPIVAGASVSAPIDLAAASQRFLARRNWLYHRRLLRSMKSESFGGKAELSDDERRAVLGAETIYDFDEHFVAPRNGFRNASHYYAENQAQRFLADIRVPTLVVHSLDDPWIPADAYRNYAWASNPLVRPLFSKGGGHVGFHDRAERVPWHDRCIGVFYEHLSV